MTFEEYCKRKESQTFTWDQVIELLERYGYNHKTIHTLVDPGQCTWLASGFKNENAAKNKIREMYEGEIPFHFAYIKFYERDGQRFAIVAGKTNLDRPDFEFTKEITATTEEGDQAKRILSDPWYCQRVLAVWETGQELWRMPDDVDLRIPGPQAKRALAVETKIKDLFGLLSS